MPLFSCFWPTGRSQVPRAQAKKLESKRSPKVLQKPRPSSDLDQQSPRSTKTQQVPRDPIQERARLEAEFDQLSRLVPIENLLTKFRELMNEIRSTGRQSMIPEEKCENWTRKVDEKLKRLSSQDLQFYYLRIVALRSDSKELEKQRFIEEDVTADLTKILETVEDEEGVAEIPNFVLYWKSDLEALFDDYLTSKVYPEEAMYAVSCELRFLAILAGRKAFSDHKSIISPFRPEDVRKHLEIWK
ncbi:hypothetical protein JCM5350_005374, partial [Sporobolomyces pararoseus]